MLLTRPAPGDVIATDARTTIVTETVVLSCITSTTGIVVIAADLTYATSDGRFVIGVPYTVLYADGRWTRQVPSLQRHDLELLHDLTTGLDG